MQLIWSNKACIAFSRVSTALAMLVLPTVALADAVQWTQAEGGNGHWYEVVIDDPKEFWPAQSASDDVGGHLVTVTTADEREFVVALVVAHLPESGYMYLGGYQDYESDDYSEPAGGWTWVSGESWGYTDWDNQQPGCCGGNEDWLNMNPTSLRWHDGPYVEHTYMIEWSADCNGDSIVDYGQILDGTYVDNDGNGVPDCCDAGEPCDVPGADLTVDDDLLDYPDADFTSIQAAIDAAQDGDLILVYPGTYTGTGNYVVDFGAKQLQLIAATGFSNTIIDGEDARGLINCSNYHDASTVIQGFGMTRGNTDGISGLPFGSLLEFTGESGPILADCRIYDMDANGSTLHAGPVHLGDAAGHPQILRCTFESINCSEILYFNYNNPRIEDCIFRSNVSTEWLGFSYHSSNHPEYINCVFDGNTVGVVGNDELGILVSRSGSLVTTTGCTFSGNTMANSCVINGTSEVGDTQFCGNFPGNDICGSWTDLGGNEFLNEPCLSFDCNENGVPDYDDIDSGYSEDCNNNGYPDECDIAEGLEEDCNGDGVPDSCQTYNDESTWTNAAGGDLLDPDNWSDCQEPAAASDLFFTLPNAYTVTCPDTEVGSASVLDGTVTLELLEGTLELGDAGDNQGLLVEGEGDEPMATLLVTGNSSGELLCTEVTIAGSESSFGALTLQGEDTLMALGSGAAIIRVGTGGTGHLSILDGATVTTGDIQLGDFGPGIGTLAIGENATIVVTDIFAIMPGSEATLVPSGKIAGSGDVRVKAGGRLSGNGIIEPDVKNFGRVEAIPGDEPMRILGDYEQPAPGTLSFSGTFAASIQDWQTWGAIHSTDDVVLGGLLDLAVDPAYTPAEGTQWPVLTAGTGITGAFDVALITGLPDGMYADIVYSNALRGGDEETVTVVFGSLDAPLAFDPPTPVTLNATPTAMLLQDLDGDGADELIIAIAGDPDGTDGTVVIYPNEEGVFADEPISLDVGPDPAVLVAGDFTGDGKIEIACANAGNNSITIFQYPMDGAMEIATLFTDGGVPVGLAAGNFLDDAASDELAVACTDTDTIEFWQHSAGLRTLDFIRRVVVDLDDTPGGIDPGQVNEDKDAFVPLAVTLPDEGDIVVLTYDVDGVDGPGYYPETYPAGANPSQVRMASLDGLATTPNDLVVLNRDDGTISILLDRGDAPYLLAANLSVGQNPDSIDLADLDADGDPDIVLVAIDSSTGESTVLILRNDFVPTGQLVFAPAAHLELPLGTIPVLVGDGAVDFDIYPDLVTINDGGAVFRSGSLPSFSIARNGLCKFPDCAGDFDGDDLVGVDDLLALIDGFGTSDGDVDCDGVSDINDLLVLIGNWGPCN